MFWKRFFVASFRIKLLHIFSTLLYTYSVVSKKHLKNTTNTVSPKPNCGFFHNRKMYFFPWNQKINIIYKMLTIDMNLNFYVNELMIGFENHNLVLGDCMCIICYVYIWTWRNLGIFKILSWKIFNHKLVLRLFW